jgi:hypothetical protein
MNLWTSGRGTDYLLEFALSPFYGKLHSPYVSDPTQVHVKPSIHTTTLHMSLTLSCMFIPTVTLHMSLTLPQVHAKPYIYVYTYRHSLYVSDPTPKSILNPPSMSIHTATLYMSLTLPPSPY